MKTKNLISLLGTGLLVLSSVSAHAERTYLAWAQRESLADTSSTYRGVVSTSDRYGYVAATGYNDLLQNDTWLTVRYDALTGIKLWEKTLAVPGYDARPAAIGTDSQGNVIVGGWASGTNGRDFRVVKYAAADGTPLWERTYNNSNANGGDEITALAVDNADGVIVTGSSVDSGKQEDYYTIKYNADGSTAWAKRYSTSFKDVPAAIAVAPNNDVAVTGKSNVAGNNCYTTIWYNASNGQVANTYNYDSPFNNNDEATDVAISADGNLYVTGVCWNPAASKYVFTTIKVGDTNWVRSYQLPELDSMQKPRLAVDAQGNALMTGTVTLDGFRTVYYAAKYKNADGSVLWENASSPLSGAPAGTFVTDRVSACAVDRNGDLVVTGTSYLAATQEDFLTIKFSGADGRIVWQQRLNGDATSGSDTAATVALTPSGDVVVTGTMDRGDSNAYYEMVTVRYNRLLISKGDPVSGPGLTSAAVVNSLAVPAILPDNSVITRISVKDGTKILGAILPTANTGNYVSALQGQPAPDVPNAKYSTFGEPVPGISGAYAFSATLTGAPTGQTSGVWTTAFGGTPRLVLQTGKQVPGMGVGVLLSAVNNFTQLSSGLVAHITVKGTGITTANNSAVIRIHGLGMGKVLYQTGTKFMQDGKEGTVKSISIFSPPANCAGQGRYAGETYTTLKLTFTDARTVIVDVLNANGSPYVLAASNGNADSIAMGAKWKSFSTPGVADSGFYNCTLATLTTGLGGVTITNDTAIVTSINATTAFTALARESGAAPGVTGGSFNTFGVPVSTLGGVYLFNGTVKGTGITTTNNAGIWFGSNPANLTLLARTGGMAPDAAGYMTSRQFNSFSTIAVASAQQNPIFKATLRGTGVTTANNSAVFSVDSDGYIRQLIRSGDKWGTLTVKSFTLLSPATKVMSATRSFNRSGNITVLVTFTNLTQSVVVINVP